MTRRKTWKSVLAGAVIGFAEVAAPEATRRALRRPEPVVRWADRGPADPLAGLGVWFLDPLPDPRPEPTDRRARIGSGPLRLVRWGVDAVARRIGGSRGRAPE